MIILTLHEYQSSHLLAGRFLLFCRCCSLLLLLCLLLCRILDCFRFTFGFL